MVETKPVILLFFNRIAGMNVMVSLFYNNVPAKKSCDYLARKTVWVRFPVRQSEISKKGWFNKHFVMGSLHFIQVATTLCHKSGQFLIEA